jgi:HSP90 family molecular chaperone
MPEITIKVSNDVQKFNHMDVLVYDKNKKEFVVKSAQELGAEIMKSFEQERIEMKNELNTAKQRYTDQLSKLTKVLDEMQNILSGGKQDV